MTDRIKKLRKALDLTQQEFADRIGMKQNTIATYEMGRATPSDPTINNICKEFNVNETWLRTGEGEMFVQLSRDEEIAAFLGQVMKTDHVDFRRRMVSVLSKLSLEEWKLLEQMAEKLLEEETKKADPGWAGLDNLIS